MRRDEDLRRVPLASRVVAELVSQEIGKFVMQPVLRLFDANERRRRRILQHEQIGECLQRAVGDLLSVKWILETLVAEAEKQAAARSEFGVDSVDARYSPGNPAQDAA